MDVAIASDQLEDGQKVGRILGPTNAARLFGDLEQYSSLSTCDRFKINDRQGPGSRGLGEMPWTFSLKMMSFARGVTERDLRVDSAQAGGLYGIVTEISSATPPGSLRSKR